jgi:hypothetical protein
MRILFISLLIANITLVAYEKFDLRTNPADIKQEMSPEKIKLLTQEELSNRTKPAAPPAPPAAMCIEWGSFIDSDLARAEHLLAPLQLTDRTKKRSREVLVGYWVNIPPLKNKSEAEKKAKELDKFGVTDYFIIQDNSDSNNAISLGVFKTEEAATNYLNQLKGKGVRSARIGTRNQTQTTLIIEDTIPTLSPRLMELQKEIPVGEMKTIECKAVEKT